MGREKQLAFEFPPPSEDSPHLLGVEEIYTRASQSLLEKLKEDRRIERKPPGYHGQPLGDYFSMWANTSPEGGLIAVGMSDAGEFLGCCSLSQDQINKIEKTGDIFCPDARFQSKRVRGVNTKGENDFIILFWVAYRADRLVENSRHEAFIRSADTKRLLRDDERRQIEIEKGQIPFEMEPCRLKFPMDFDMLAINQFVAAVRSAMAWDEDKSVEDVLELRRLGKKAAGKFVPNQACALLFAVDPNIVVPGSMVRFLRFDGVSEGTGEKFNAVKDIPIEGTVPKIIAECEKVLDSQVREFSHLAGDGKFYPEPEYPKWAWYEAVVNACVHRSYSLKNMPVFIKMFDDRLIIESPGGFPPFVTPANIYETHHPRNPALIWAMYYLKYVRCAREGTRRMRDTMVGAKLPAPEFAQKANGHVLVRVTLRNNIAHRRVYVDKDAGVLIGAVLASTLEERELKIVNFASEYGSINVSQAQRVTGAGWRSSKKLLDGLVSKGIFRRVGRNDVDRDPKAHYVLAVKNGGKRSNGSKNAE